MPEDHKTNSNICVMKISTQFLSKSNRFAIDKTETFYIRNFDSSLNSNTLVHN